MGDLLKKIQIKYHRFQYITSPFRKSSKRLKYYSKTNTIKTLKKYKK